MKPMKIIQYAQALYSAHGDKAEAEAARRANEAREAGRLDEARTWQSVRASIRQRRGPNQA